MGIFGTVCGIILVLLVLIDAFESIIHPRRVTHRFRYARLYYRSTWAVWRAAALVLRSGRRRESFISVFGPLSLLGLFATWVLGLILGFALIHWSLRLPLDAPEAPANFWKYLYFSASACFTVGFVRPAVPLGSALAVIESGLGFAFLAIIIGYLPVLYQAFSRREATIALMDGRAGSPPSAGQLLLRLGRSGNVAPVDSFLVEWEAWAAELLESHLSFPVLSYYRSQHDNQSWLAVLTVVLDTCALLLAAVKGCNHYRAQLTFAMARHAAVDLGLIFQAPPEDPNPARLPTGQWPLLRQALADAGLEVRDGSDAETKLAELRQMYEPFVNALARRLLFTLPPLMPAEPIADNWQRSAWMRRTPGIGNLPGARDENAHFT